MKIIFPLRTRFSTINFTEDFKSQGFFQHAFFHRFYPGIAFVITYHRSTSFECGLGC